MRVRRYDDVLLTPTCLLLREVKYRKRRQSFRLAFAVLQANFAVLCTITHSNFHTSRAFHLFWPHLLCCRP